MSGWLPCPSRGGQGRHVGQPDRDRSTAAALAQAGHHLAEPPRSFVEVTGSTGNQAEVAQRINGIGWHPGTLDVVHDVPQQTTGTRLVPLRPGDDAEVKARVGKPVFMSSLAEIRLVVTKIALVRREERFGCVIPPLADVDPTKQAACGR